MITFNFKDKTVTVNTHSVEGQELYKAQDLLKGYGLEGRKVSDTLADWKCTESSIWDFPISVKGGTNQGTWLDKKALLSLATYVSKELFSAVIDAFLALLEGNAQEASNIAGNAAQLN